MAVLSCPPLTFGLGPRRTFASCEQSVGEDSHGTKLSTLQSKVLLYEVYTLLSITTSVKAATQSRRARLPE